MAEISDRLDARIAHLDSEITRISANATKDVQALKAQKSVLVRAKAALTVENEALLTDLQAAGILAK